MKVYKDVEQRSEEWFALRAGKFTASEDFQVLCTGRPDTVRKLLRRIAAERITGDVTTNGYRNANMDRGVALEAEAVEAFEMETGLAVERVGFIDGENGAGASPDGLIGEDEGIEIKCRDIHTHLDLFFDGWDTSYKWQIQGNLWISGRRRWYFVSYNPKYAHLNKHLFIHPIERDEAMIRQIADAVERGNVSAQSLIQSITGA